MWDPLTNSWMSPEAWKAQEKADREFLAGREIAERVTEYVYSYLPEGHELYFSLSITVESRGDDTWAVCDRMQRVMDAKGRWKHEPLPSSRTDAFKRRYRHDLETAKRLAREHLSEMVVMNWNAAKVIQQDHENG
jgi:hypothetical protein